MAYNFSEFKKRLKEVEEHLKHELSSVRTGLATPALLDGVSVEAYGSRTPLSQVASINLEDPRTIRIAPWDATLIKDIEKAISVADLGVSASADEKGVRVIFPELTGERRLEMGKKVKTKLEEGRVKLRSAREHVWNDIQKKEKEGGMSEDEKFRAKEEMEKMVQEGNKLMEALAVRKEKEITG